MLESAPEIPEIQVPVLGRPVGRIGYGLMGLSWGPPQGRLTDQESFDAIRTAVDGGANLLNSGTFYGPPDDQLANLKLLRRFFDAYPDYVDKAVVCVKGGVSAARRLLTGKSDFLREDLQIIQANLGPRKKLDIYEIARIPTDVSVAEMMQNLTTLIAEGHFAAISLCEATAATLRAANEVHRISFLEIEVSLWSLEPLIVEAVQAATELGVPITAYSPLGRGFLARMFQSYEDIPDGDMRRSHPRFQGEAFNKNLELVDKVEEIAKRKQVTAGQLALAYILQMSPMIVPIPGSSKPYRIAENIAAANITLSSDEVKEIDSILATFKTEGNRYPDHGMATLMK